MSLLALSVTLRLLTDNDNYRRVFIAMHIWNLMGPLGIFLSLSISSSNLQDFTSINAILQCLSAGTFLYITFIDMLADDLLRQRLSSFVNILLIFIGFIIVVLASYWHRHSH
jgi:zinc transporter ZupT